MLFDQDFTVSKIIHIQVHNDRNKITECDFMTIDRQEYISLPLMTVAETANVARRRERRPARDSDTSYQKREMHESCSFSVGLLPSVCRGHRADRETRRTCLYANLVSAIDHLLHSHFVRNVADQPGAMADHHKTGSSTYEAVLPPMST